jgi:hypothetical protein
MNEWEKRGIDGEDLIILIKTGFVGRNNQYDNFHIGFEYSYTEDELLNEQKEYSTLPSLLLLTHSIFVFNTEH